MTEPRPRRRGGALRSFLFGGVVGGAIAVAAPRFRKGRAPRGAGPRPVAGLEAFEGAPCWEHDRRGDTAAGAAPGDDL